MTATPSLFTPYLIGPLALSNRIVIAPMCMYRAEEGKMSRFHSMHVGSMATSGAGLVILEATAVKPEGRISPFCCGIWDDATAGALKRVLDEVRTYSDTPIAIQLAHAGRKASCNPCFTNIRPADVQLLPSHQDGWQTEAPSSIPFRSAEHPPKALSVEEIQQIQAAFAAAAARACAAGINGIELHFAHGYLAHEFLSPLSNHRTDQYGGSLENRMRMPLETFSAVRAAVPADVPVWVRISATDWAPNSDGWDVAEAVVFCKALKEMGCDAVHVSSGGLLEAQAIRVRPGYQLPHAKIIRDATGLNTIAVGLITEAEQAESVVVSGVADAVAIGRQILYNPRWPYEAAHKLGTRVQAPPQYWRCEPTPQRNIFAPPA